MSATNFPFNKVRLLPQDEKKLFFSQESNYKIYFFSDSVIEKYYDYINWDFYIISYINNTSQNIKKINKLIRNLYEKYHKQSFNCSFCEAIQVRECFNENKYNRID